MQWYGDVMGNSTNTWYIAVPQISRLKVYVLKFNGHVFWSITEAEPHMTANFMLRIESTSGFSGHVCSYIVYYRSQRNLTTVYVYMCSSEKCKWLLTLPLRALTLIVLTLLLNAFITDSLNCKSVNSYLVCSSGVRVNERACLLLTEVYNMWRNMELWTAYRS